MFEFCCRFLLLLIWCAMQIQYSIVALHFRSIEEFIHRFHSIFPSIIKKPLGISNSFKVTKVAIKTVQGVWYIINKRKCSGLRRVVPECFQFSNLDFNVKRCRFIDDAIYHFAMLIAELLNKEI